MAIGSNYSVILSIQFTETMSITDLYAYDRIYMESGDDDKLAIIGLCHNGASNVIISSDELPVGAGNERKILQAILKEITTYITNSIVQKSKSSSQQKSSGIIVLDSDWLRKQMNS